MDPRAAPFVVDPTAQRVHRRAGPRFAECERTLDWNAAQGAEDVLKASMVLKTRHYLPCERCWK